MMGSLAGCCLLQDLSLGLIITSSWDVSGTLGLSFNCLCFYFFLSLSFSVFLLISVSSYQFPHLCFFLSFRLSLSLSLCCLSFSHLMSLSFFLLFQLRPYFHLILISLFLSSICQLLILNLFNLKLSYFILLRVLFRLLVSLLLTTIGEHSNRLVTVNRGKSQFDSLPIKSRSDLSQLQDNFN